ncbi:SDR family oxidoreductase [Actinomadura terrae]|uniref:SDR family oxidoreductase n=1 Tax=Actinomadura terrae TaxID=604353 RepID=UPI001FA6DCEA|nr:SDR family oxidoreductase [Actinomadura terrae]
MTGARTAAQVVIVGAGPVGLLLAGELRLGGVDVVVLERRAEPATESRASTLHARTMEIFDSRGLLEAFGPLPNEVMGHFGGISLDLTLPGPYPGQWKVPQTTTEAVLRCWALSLGADLRRGHDLRGITVHPDHVDAVARTPEGPARLRAQYLVGCDGEQSTVRALIGAEFPGRDARRELIRADVDGIEIPDRRFEWLPGGLAIAARRGDGVTRVMAHEFGRAAASRPAGAPDFGEVRDVWRRVTGEDIGHGTPLWVNAFGDASRLLASYRHGRVLFAGDAAHLQLPAGGQALNLGLQDAFNLGWKLALDVRGAASGGLLGSYHDERHAVGARVLGNIGAQATLLLGGPETEAVRAVFAELMGHEHVRRHLAGTISGLDVRYDAGEDRDAGHPLLGYRHPPGELWIEAVPTSTAALLRTGRGLLLDPAGELRGVAAPWADRVAVVTARGSDDGARLIRPDGYVAWASATGSTGLRGALERWFGRPATGAFSAPTAPTTSANCERSAEMEQFAGRTALVTGASRGIGRQIAARLAGAGALVAVHYSHGREAAEEVVAAIEKDGGRAFTVQAEFGRPGDVHQLFLELERGLKERTGSVELNILVNNAGVMGGVAPEETTPEKFDELFAVNAKAPFFVIQRALPNLASGGRVINISSGLTRFANPDEIAYAMTKGAVEQLALHFAKFLAPRHITINSVAPGITRNGSPVFDIPEAVEQMARLSVFGRIGEPADIADVVAFLASDDARWVTGAFIDASGGTLLG